MSLHTGFRLGAPIISFQVAKHCVLPSCCVIFFYSRSSSNWKETAKVVTVIPEFERQTLTASAASSDHVPSRQVPCLLVDNVGMLVRLVESGQGSPRLVESGSDRRRENRESVSPAPRKRQRHRKFDISEAWKSLWLYLLHTGLISVRLTCNCLVSACTCR